MIELNKSVSSFHKLKIKKWWKIFQENEAIISSIFSDHEQCDFDLPLWMNKNLGLIDPNLMWEFGVGLKKAHRLVITPELDISLRPLVRYLLKESPKFNDWEFYEYRLEETYQEAQLTINSRTNFGINISDVEFILSEGDFNRIDVTAYLPVLKERDIAIANINLLLETLLGEERWLKWGGYINIEKRTEKRHINSINLKDEFQVVIEKIKNLIPDFSKNNYSNKEYSLFTLDPEELTDYPEQQDMYSAVTFSQRIFLTINNRNVDFFSERFSNKDNIFIYIKIDGSASDLNLATLADRTSIEDELDNILRKKKLGCAIGGGTGKRYSYIELMVSNIFCSVELIQKTLQSKKITKSSWILFHDADLKKEWIGIWNDSSMPFMD